MNTKFIAMGASAIMLLTACGQQKPAGTANAPQSAAQAADNPYSALAALPDWGGVWESAYYSYTGQLHRLEELPPLKDKAVLARYEQSLKEDMQGGDNIARAAQRAGGNRPAAGAPGGAGQPQCTIGNMGGNSFNGLIGIGPATAVEFIFTPGRVIIAGDSGSPRRVYTDGRPLPVDPFPKAMGTSIGHWEGKTLVVETVGLSPETRLPSGVKAGRGMKVTERIYFPGPETKGYATALERVKMKAQPGQSTEILEVDATIEAPEVLTGPYTVTQHYARYHDRTIEMGEFVSECGHADRSIDQAKQKQQFDLTPPPDIPPPPKN